MPKIGDFLPAPPDWALDWAGIDAGFAWVRAMRGSTQDPIHHAEGDVWIHTRMVVEALIALPEWRAATPDDRLVAFAAALLHDVAKPKTREERDGRIGNPHHSPIGARDARRLLWEMKLPFALREAVCAIIAAHQKPFYLVEYLDSRRWDADRTLVATSLSVSNRLLALVAEADARGRISADRQRLLDNIELFREMARELGCYDTEFPFHSPYARFEYFQNPERHRPDIELHDTTSDAFTVTVMSGLPGSGKSEWVARATQPAGACAGQPIVSLDGLRRELRIDPEDEQGAVIQAAKERAKALLGRRQSFLWDATCLSATQRAQVIATLLDGGFRKERNAGYGARIQIAYVEAPMAETLRRNRERDARVPDAAMERMLRRWEPPTLAECHRLLRSVAE
jgi:predicted kinase